MANKVSKLTDPSGNYSGGYTSNVFVCSTRNNSMNNAPRGAIQFYIIYGHVDLQMRLTSDAPWVTVKTYTESTIDEMVLPHEIRVVVSDSAHVWVAELT